MLEGEKVNKGELAAKAFITRMPLTYHLSNISVLLTRGGKQNLANLMSLLQAPFYLWLSCHFPSPTPPYVYSLLRCFTQCTTFHSGPLVFRGHFHLLSFEISSPGSLLFIISTIKKGFNSPTSTSRLHSFAITTARSIPVTLQPYILCTILSYYSATLNSLDQNPQFFSQHPAISFL